MITFERTIQTEIENMIHSRGINRIRHYYVELAPQIKRYFIHSIHDDVAGAVQDMSIISSNSWRQYLVTNTGIVAVINSVLTGVFVGMVSRFASSLPVYVCTGLGITGLAWGGGASTLSIEKIPGIREQAGDALSE